MADFFHTTEFLILTLILAAAIVAYLAIPSGHGPVRELTLGGELLPLTPDDAEPAVTLTAHDNGTVTLVRTGLIGVDASGAVSLALTVKGFDITVEERITPGRYGGEPVGAAMFTLDFLGRERYHIRYNSSQTSTAATLSLNNRSGYNTRVRLSH